MYHQAQKGSCGIFVGIPQHQKDYFVYVLSTRRIIYDVIFDESFSSLLVDMSRPYSEAMVIHLSVTYTPYATCSKEKTGDIITITQFGEGDLLSENIEDAESG